MTGPKVMTLPLTPQPVGEPSVKTATTLLLPGAFTAPRRFPDGATPFTFCEFVLPFGAGASNFTAAPSGSEPLYSKSQVSFLPHEVQIS